MTSGELNVTDYGSVNLQSQLQTRNPGNPVYSAPESGDKSQHFDNRGLLSFLKSLNESFHLQYSGQVRSCQSLPSCKPRKPTIRKLAVLKEKAAVIY